MTKHMLLCDHIVFWMRHNERPRMEGFELAMYELQVAMEYAEGQLKRLAAAVMAPAIKKFAEAITDAAYTAPADPDWPEVIE